MVSTLSRSDFFHDSPNSHVSLIFHLSLHPIHFSISSMYKLIRDKHSLEADGILILEDSALALGSKLEA